MATKENRYPSVPPQAPQPFFAQRIAAQPPAIYSSGVAGRTTPETLAAGRRIRIAVLATFLFMALSYYGTYRVANNIYGALTSQPNVILDVEGGLTVKGTFIIAAVFFVGMFFVF